MSTTAVVGDELHLRNLWARLGEGEHSTDAIRSLCGIPESWLSDLAVLTGAASTATRRLLDTVPMLLHGLLTTTSMQPERCVGHVRGPVLWSETLNARAHTLGGDDVFVCGVQGRDFDVAENHVLLGALDLVARAAALLDSEAASLLSEEMLQEIRNRAANARSLRGDKHLEEVHRVRVTRSMLHTVRRGRRARQYAAAVDVMARRASPFDADALVAVCDPTSRGQLRALDLVLGALADRNEKIGPLRCDGTEAMIGPIRYRNWRHATSQGRYGILMGGLLMDGPATTDGAARAALVSSLEDRARDGRYCVVATRDDAVIAVDMALGGRARP
jgi:hypothetical protein